MILLMNYFYRINERRKLTNAMLIGAVLGSVATIVAFSLINKTNFYYDNDDSYINDEGEVDITVETFPDNIASSKTEDTEDSYITLSTEDNSL